VPQTRHWGLQRAGWALGVLVGVPILGVAVVWPFDAERGWGRPGRAWLGPPSWFGRTRAVFTVLSWWSCRSLTGWGRQCRQPR
jgi:hypothetical protein